MTTQVNVEKSKSPALELNNRNPYWAWFSFILMPTDGKRKDAICRWLWGITGLRAA